MNRHKIVLFIVAITVVIFGAGALIAGSVGVNWYQNNVLVARENNADFLTSQCITPNLTDDVPSSTMQLSLQYTCPTPTPTIHLIQDLSTQTNTTNVLAPIPAFTFTFPSGKGLRITCNIQTESSSLSTGLRFGWTTTPAMLVSQSMLWSMSNVNATVTSDTSVAFSIQMISPAFQVANQTVFQRYESTILDFGAPQTVTMGFADTDNASTVEIEAGSTCFWSSQ